MKRRALSLLLAMAMLLTLAVAAPAMAEDEQAELTFSYWGDGAEKASIEAALAGFTEETGIKVTPVYIPEDYLTKITTMAASDTLPDTGYFSEPACIEWGMSGMFVDLTEEYTNGELAGKIASNLFTGPDGTIYGASLANEAIIMFYNKALFDAAGLEYPPATAADAWTWDEFVEVAKKLTVDYSGNHPDDEGFNPEDVQTFGVRFDQGSYLYNALMVSNKGGYVNTTYDELILDSPESIEVFQALGDLINVHHVNPTPGQSSTVPDTGTAFLSNRLAMQLTGQWALQSLSEAAKTDGISYGIGVLPKFQEALTTNTGTTIVVFNSCENVEAAVKLVKYIMNPEKSITLINSGLWQPNEESWYTDPDLIAKWMVEGVHPAEYKTAVIDYSLSSIVPHPFFRIASTNQIDNLVNPALDTVWAGTATAEEAITSVIEDVRKAFEEGL